MNEWHYALNGQQHGPVSAEEIRQLQAGGILSASSLVWRAGMTDWTALGAVPESDLPLQSGRSSRWNVGDSVSEAGSAQELPFEFRGNALEYFRIWIVNVVLTVLTLGIYAAWAKVRTRRYFYGNTLLDGKPFDFTGNPVAILKGNLIFGALFAAYSITLQLYPFVGFAILGVILLISPWLIQKALRFRAHHTVYRNVRFHFRGSLGEAYSVFLGLVFLVPLTLGLIVPYLQFRQRKFFLGGMAWGNSQAEMHGRAGFFYKTFFKYLGILVLLGVIMTLVVGGMTMSKIQSHLSSDAAEKVEKASPSPVQTELEKQVATEIEKQIQANPNLTEEEKQLMRDSAGAGAEAMAEMMWMVLPFYLLIFVSMIYYQVRTQNYAINMTLWGKLGRVDSKVRVRDLIWLYLSNGLAVLVSLGLLIPWVLVRMARYRASKTRFLAHQSLDDVAQSMSSSESAMGDAGADIFDFEIGF